MRFFYWFLTALLALVIADFAVSNRAAVTLSLWPFADTIVTETFVPILLALLLAFLLGLLVAWSWSWRVRRRARAHARRIAALEREAKQRETKPREERSAGALIEGR